MKRDPADSLGTLLERHGPISVRPFGIPRVTLPFRASEIDLSHVLRLADMESVIVVDGIRGMPPDDPDETERQLLLLAASRPISIVSLWEGAELTLATSLARAFGNVVLSPEQREQVFRAESPVTAIRGLLMKSLGRARLAPFNSNGAVTGSRFFGRLPQIKSIIEEPTTSYLVTGARMIGKSSLLQEAKRRIDQRDGQLLAHSDMPTSTLYFDCRTFADLGSLIEAFLSKLGYSTKWARRQNWDRRRLGEFCRVLRHYARENPTKRLHVFLDEYDHIQTLRRAGEQALTWHLRALRQDNSSATGVIQFVLAGSRSLRIQSIDNQSDLYNFVDTDRCQLDNFDLETTTQLAVRPLQDLGYRIEDDGSLANKIMSETGGRPSSIQFLCESMLRHVQRRSVDTITLNDAAAVIHSASFVEHYRDVVLQNMDSLEQYIIACTLENRLAERAFRFDDLQRLGKQLNVVTRAQVSTALNDLVVSGFLSEEDGGTRGYRFRLTTPDLMKRVFAGITSSSLAPKVQLVQ